jgi:DNA replication protein DnaC
LPDILEQAENAELTYRQFLLELLEIEVKGRNERRRKRNYSAAHFPPHPRRLEEFDPGEL